MDNAVDLESNH
jgi:ABC-type polysaccharide/polyol phosphate transport system ATPase subunit